MTAKKKAIELIEQFDSLLNPDSQTYKCTECIDAAIICVEEILNLYKEEFIRGGKFWEDVKIELEKLK